MTNLPLTSLRIPGAVIYTRVSTGDQDKNGTSPETQLDACRAKALILGIPIAAEYHDGGVSGSLLARTGMQAALADIQTGRADTLICANISRYSRDVEHQQAIKKAVKSAGGRLVFCDMDFDDTPEGDLAFGIMGGFAQYEKALIKDRTMKGKRKRAEEGQQPQRSTPAYGYLIITNAQVECGLYPPEMRGRYIIAEEKAEIVRDLFTQYAAGWGGFAPLAQLLNTRRIPATRGGLWHPICVGIILRNPVYKGQPAYGRTSRTLDEAGPNDRNQFTGVPLLRPRATLKAGERPVLLTAPPIVSEELWNAVQVRLAKNQKVLVGNPKQARMLTGRVECPCGHRAAIVGSKSSKAYQCFAERQSRFLRGISVCQNATYALPRTEQSVITSLLDAAARPEALAAAAQAYGETMTGQQPLTTSPASLRRERAGIDAALSRIAQDEIATVQAQIAGIRAGASPDAYASVFADLGSQRKDLEDRRGVIVQRLKMDNREPQEGEIKPENKGRQITQSNMTSQVLLDTARVLTSEAVLGQEKRDLIGSVISRVVCQVGGADIYYLPGVLPEASSIASSTLTELMQ